MRKIFQSILLVPVLLLATLLSAQEKMPDKASVDKEALKKANELLAKMTLEEKIKLTHGVSTMSVAQIKSIGMPSEFTMSDGPHNEDSPAHHIPGNWDGKTAPHKEGVFIGYRWFRKKNIKPQFAFGHGLSYTTFKIGKPTLSKSSIKPGESLTATVEVTNTGKVKFTLK